MQKDFHYYAAYCAAFLAGYTPDEAARIAYADQFTDCCTATLLASLHAPVSAATTQSQAELINARTDVVGLQNITRIWASFHFLPGDLYADIRHGSRGYKSRYRLICEPNSDLVIKTVKLAAGRDLESAGLAMHILADTWAHRHFAGTPSQVINDVNFEVTEVLPAGQERPVRFHVGTGGDNPDTGVYIHSVNNYSENSVMLLGHGRAGHLPDYSYITYRYMPVWADYDLITKDNPSDYMRAFRQTVYALKYLRGDEPDFVRAAYNTAAVDPWKEKIDAILRRRQTDSCDDWAALGEEMTGQALPPFDTAEWEREYIAAGAARDDTPLGRYTLAAMRQKSMVTREIYESGSLMAGFSADYRDTGFKGIRDFRKLIEKAAMRNEH